MKNIIIIIIATTLFISNGYSQSKGETGTSMFPWDISKKEVTAFYGMKVYDNDGKKILFITDAFKLCEETDKYDALKFEENLQSYIEANYVKQIKGANKYVNYGGLSGFTHICYFFKDEGESQNDNYQEAREAKTKAVSTIVMNNEDFLIIQIKKEDFDFYQNCE
ncbi:hypothetical protein [Algibacter lectus]|uniref:Uncharacterized protein n=1 Tax=Algibacter lectus TaxID=221126 RepID=A0A4R8MAA5_9FLAO|nr:hypothetical protein [Algibacter lectus]MWW25755.1 hypothetical protein [Algibacter lectus]TDY61037.1 hypothetical protein DFQ06_3048 [Algibacter lectus]